MQTTTATKRKAAMESFGIHEDHQMNNQSEEETVRPSQEDVEQEEDKDDEDWGVSDDDDDGVVNEAVAEDMEKFKNSIRGISRRFRLIKRIGEGMFYLSSE